MSIFNFNSKPTVDEDIVGRNVPTRSGSHNSTVSTTSLQILAASARIQLDISDLYFHMATVGKIKVMLKDINLQIKSGEMCAIMGPTGSGKSTLLELIANRKSSGFWCGEVLVNKKARPEWFHRISAYVFQEDVLLPTFTIRETLMYAACTRMEGTSMLKEREQRVLYLIDLFGLMDVCDKLIGEIGEPNALTEGQRKKVAIMQEIVGIPRVLFMDEPTSCMDRVTAMECMTAVRRITDSSRICLTTIHHPSSELFALFDRLILLSAGRVIYSGPIDKVVTYFESIGFPYVSSQIAGDYIIQICGDKQKSPVEFQALFHASKYYPESIGNDSRNNSVDQSTINTALNSGRATESSGGSGSQKHDHSKHNNGGHETHNPIMFSLGSNGKKSGNMSSNNTVETSLGFNEMTSLVQPVQSSLFRQLGMLTHRGLLHNFRDWRTVKDELAKSVFFGLFIGMTFYDNANISAPYLINNNATQYQDRPTSELVNFTSIFYYIFIFMWFNNTLSIHSLAVWNALYRRELSANAYSTYPYWLSALNVKLPFRLVTFTIFMGIIYPMCGFPQSVSYFFLFYVIMFMTGIMSFYASQTCVVLFGSEQTAYAVVPHLFMFFGLFSGYPLLLGNVPPGYIWAPYISFLRWSFESLMVNQFGDNSTLGVDDDTLNLGAAAVTDFYSFDDYKKSSTFLILLLCLVILSVITYYGMTKVTNTLFHLSSCDHSKDTASSRGHSESSGMHHNKHHHHGDGMETFNVEAGSTNMSHSSTNSSYLQSSYFTGGSHSHGGGGGGMGGGSSFGRHSEDRRSQLFHHHGATALSSLRLSLSRISGGHFVGPNEITIEDPDRYFALDLDDFRSSNIGAENTRGVKIDLVNMSYNYISGDGQQFDVLSGISGSIPSGKMVALMGGADCGKHSLLDVVAGRRHIGSMSGMLLFNGMERTDDIMRVTSYVNRTDIHLSMLTVRETLQFAAEMRMDETPLNKEIRVNKVMELMYLKEQSEMLVGGDGHIVRGLTAGQRRRLSIGVEIINFPSLIFMDEPTTGLDSVTSDEVISAVRNLANQNRTAMCTVVHPSTKAFEAFDLLVLLSKGQIVYFGPIKHAVNFFHRSPYEFNYDTAFINPAEFVLAVSECAIQSKQGKIVATDELVEYFRSKQSEIHVQESSFSSDHVSALTQSATMFHLGDYPVFIYKSSTYKQLVTLIQRYRLRTLRTRQPLYISAGRCIFVGFLLGSVFNNSITGSAFAAYKNRYTFCFMSLFFNVLVQMQTIPIYFEDLAQFNKEKEAKLFQPACYWLSIWLVHCLLIFGHTLLFVILAYSISGFCATVMEFVVYFTVLYLSAYCAFIYTQICCMCSKRMEGAIRSFIISILINCLFTGYFQYIPDMQFFLKHWLPHLSFMRWAYQALVINELENDDQLSNSQYYLDSQNFNHSNLGECLGILIFYTVVNALVLIGIVLYQSRD